MSPWRMVLFLTLALGVPCSAAVFGPFAHYGWLGRLTGVLCAQCLALVAGLALEEQHVLAKQSEAMRGEGGAGA